MPCTYCGSNKHTRGKCDKIEKDFKTYEKVSILAREKYINTLLEKGIRPGSIVKTHNRTKNFMQKSSETEVVSLGRMDVLSHYNKIGRSISGIYIESQNLIELADDNDDMVSIKHCHEVVELSSTEWDATGEWTQTQLLDFGEFKALFKGKKRHPAFTGELYTCIVKELTEKKETTEEIAARVAAEIERKEATLAEREDALEVEGESVYVITATSTCDDYKRPYTDSESYTASNWESAVAIAAKMYLERAQDYDLFAYDSEGREGFRNAVASSDQVLAELVYDHFYENEESLFAGEYVPQTFQVTIQNQATSTVSESSLDRLVSGLLRG